MSHNPTILDLISASQSQPGVTANALFDAASPATLFGRRASMSTGLTWGYYGGAFWNGTTLTTVADGTVALTASTTNYVYATSAGVVTVATSAPTGWPSALASGATPLYQLTVGSVAPTAWTDYRVAGSNLPPTTITNIVNTTVISQSITSGGQPNLGLVRYVQGVWEQSSPGPGPSQQYGSGAWNTSGGAGSTGATLDYSSAFKSVPRAQFSGAAPAGSGMYAQTQARWALTSIIPTAGGWQSFFLHGIQTAPAGMRCFFGFYVTSGLPANADPSSFLNIIGFGADTGDANLQFMCNDGSGTATKVDCGSSFPARTNGVDMYLMRMNAAPGQTGAVDYSIFNLNGAVTFSGTAASNLPVANTQLFFTMWWNNAATASAISAAPSRVLIQSNY